MDKKMFEDFDLFKEKCKYVNCTHIHEPNCAVLEAVETGKIDSERYHSYLNIFDSIKK